MSHIPPASLTAAERSSQVLSTSKNGPRKKPPRITTCTGTTHSCGALEVTHTHYSAPSCPVLVSPQLKTDARPLLSGYPSVFSSFRDLSLHHALGQDQASCDATRQSALQHGQPRFTLLKLPIPAIKLPAKTNWIKLRSDYVRAGLQGLFAPAFLQ